MQRATNKFLLQDSPERAYSIAQGTALGGGEKQILKGKRQYAKGNQQVFVTR